MDGMQTKTDGELLEAFVERGEEAAFAELFSRYNKMVYRKCARILRDNHAAEDATQAVFLVLSQKARNLRREDLTGWVYRVAHLTATDAARRRVRRAQRETAYMNDETVLQDAGCDETQVEAILGVLDEELEKMSGKNRNAVILRYLQGFSQEEAAQRAECSVKALSVRASRGLEQLRQRLARRGVAVSSVALVAVLHAEAHAAVPAALTASVLTAVKAGTAKGLAEGVISKSVMTMTKGVAKAMFWTKVQVTAAAVVGTVAVVSYGVYFSSDERTPSDENSKKRVHQVAESTQESAQMKTVTNWMRAAVVAGGVLQATNLALAENAENTAPVSTDNPRVMVNGPQGPVQLGPNTSSSRAQVGGERGAPRANAQVETVVDVTVTGTVSKKSRNKDEGEKDFYVIETAGEKARVQAYYTTLDLSAFVGQKVKIVGKVKGLWFTVITSTTAVQ
jgi:RNA polymerase sigma factor (sigma-70 family)